MTTVQRRNTSQRAAISELLGGTDEFVSAQDLHASLRASGSTVGLATVYRALQDMATAGAVDAVRNENGEVLYRRCAVPSHHHHLVCRTCGRTEEIDAPAVEAWARGVAEKYGYTDVDHDVELFGLCSTCSQATHR
jgi:Fur family ferric uptake transcriptional regulator